MTRFTLSYKVHGVNDRRVSPAGFGAPHHLARHDASESVADRPVPACKRWCPLPAPSLLL